MITVEEELDILERIMSMKEIGAFTISDRMWHELDRRRLYDPDWWRGKCYRSREVGDHEIYWQEPGVLIEEFERYVELIEFT